MAYKTMAIGDTMTVAEVPAKAVMRYEDGVFVKVPISYDVEDHERCTVVPVKDHQAQHWSLSADYQVTLVAWCVEDYAEQRADERVEQVLEVMKLEKNDADDPCEGLIKALGIQRERLDRFNKRLYKAECDIQNHSTQLMDIAQQMQGLAQQKNKDAGAGIEDRLGMLTERVDSICQSISGWKVGPALADHYRRICKLEIWRRERETQLSSEKQERG